MSPDDLADLLPSWQVHLRAARKTDGTIKTYMAGVDPYLDWCRTHDAEPLSRRSLEAWAVELVDAGRAAATVKTRMMGVRHFARWLADEDEIPDNPFASVTMPKIDEPTIPVLTPEQLRALIKACAPPQGETSGLPALRHRRDEAIIRLLADTGLRASECINLTVADVDLTDMVLTVRRGKGGKGRRVPFHAEAAQAVDRYKRVRKLHRLAGEPNLWLGDRGRLLAYNGLYWALGERAKAAGIEHFHPHMLRHTSVDRWLAAGGSETGAMSVHGWSSPAMLQRYGRANREQRAIDEARRLDLGEL